MLDEMSPADVEAVFSALRAAGYTEIRTYTRAYVEAGQAAPVVAPPPTPPPPPPTPPPPAPPWWAALKAGDRVKLARAGVKIYYDPSPTANLWNTLSDGRTMDVFGVSGDYIQVKQFPPFNLWVAAGDVVKA